MTHETPDAGLSVKQIAEWYIRRWEKRTGRPWPQTGRRRMNLPGDAGAGVRDET